MTLLGPLIITGATGNLGQLVTKELLETPKIPPANHCVTHTVEKLADLKKMRVNVRAGDFNDVNSLKTAFKGEERILIIATKDFQNRRQHHEAAIKEAAAARVKHRHCGSAGKRQVIFSEPPGN